MAQKASFFTLPISKVEEVRKAVKEGEENLTALLAKKGTLLKEVPDSGRYFSAVLFYLQEEKNIELMDSDYEGLGELLFDATDETTFIFSQEHKIAHAESISPKNHSIRALSEFYKDYAGESDEKDGESMVLALTTVQESLLKAEKNRLVLLLIG
jgi:hypothetical protein